MRTKGGAIALVLGSVLSVGIFGFARLSKPPLPQGSCLTCNGSTAEVVNLNATGTGTFGGLISANDGFTANAPGINDNSLTTYLKRVHYAGTAVTTANFALSSGWGSGTSCSLNCTPFDNPVDSSGFLKIKSGNTSITANPTVTFTFADGGEINDVLCLAVRADAVNDTASWRISATNTRSVTWTFEGTPAAATTYGLVWHCDFH